MGGDFERLGALLALVQERTAIAALCDLTPPSSARSGSGVTIGGCAHCEVNVIAATQQQQQQRSASSSLASSSTTSQSSSSSSSTAGDHFALVRHGPWLLAVTPSDVVVHSLRLVEATIALAADQSSSSSSSSSSMEGFVNITVGKRVVSIRAHAASALTNVVDDGSSSPVSAMPVVPAAALLALLVTARSEAIGELCTHYVERFRSLSKQAQTLHDGTE